MKQFAVTFIMVFVFSGIAAQAQSTCNTRSAGKLAADLAAAYEARDLGKLDAKRPYLTTFGIRIENSLAGDGDKDQFVNRRFRTLKAAERWLQSRETKFEDQISPSRVIMPLISCKSGICTYNIEGLLHNQLFLKRLYYGNKKNGCPYIKTIYLIDGN